MTADFTPESLRDEREGLKRDFDLLVARSDELHTELDGLRQQHQTIVQQIEVATERLAECEAAMREVEQVDELARERQQQLAERQTEPQNGDALHALADKAQQFGQFTIEDLAAVLRMPLKTAKAQVKLLVELNSVRPTGRKVLGKPLFEHIAAVREQKAEESAAFHDVRDFAVKAKKPFSPKNVTDATEVEGRELIEALQELLSKGVIEYVGLDDLELYQYVPPTDEGEAARRDRQRAKELAAREQTIAASSGPVEGTGGAHVKANDPDVRALIDAIVAAGGSVDREGGSGHIGVTAPGTKRRVLISSTPRNRRSILNDRARVRRELGLQI